ncbi:hypothetical protein VIGAN_01204700 [Vigna angularis var. angularis]|uniref:Uncharacterized protein n=1 Tax=Vigna angularis var. angularis TaxID=157739 RepID=A0A0S3R1D7_PHAAN|nr:hypothetical protein VIGAN_01204700 [Vigna angularis var. angularis]
MKAFLVHVDLSEVARDTYLSLRTTYPILLLRQPVPFPTPELACPCRKSGDFLNGERGEMKGFWRKPRTEMESVRFSTSKYPNEGPSNGFSSSYMGSWRNRNEADGVDGKEGGKGGAGC